MNILNSTNNKTIIAVIFIIVAVVILLCLLAFILYKFVFSRTIAKNNLKEIQRKYQYLSSSLIGNDGQYIHRLETISRTNILYISTYESFTKRFKDIHEVDEKFAQSKIKQVESLIANGHFKNINSYIDEARKAVAIFEEQVNKLHADLYEVIKPEEDARKIIHELKESYRSVKQTFYVTQTDLELAANSFLKTFEKLDQCFSDFETYIDSAKYEEANALLPTIRKVILALKDVLDKMPNLCVLVISIIPEKLDILNDNYKRLEVEDFPLWHLGYSAKKERWVSSLEECKKKLINLQTGGVLEECQTIQKEIEDFQTSLNSETQSKEEFDISNSELYRNVNNLEKSFVNICNLLPQISQAYKIEASEEQKIQILKENIDRLGASKRSLDVFIHSNTKQPYSILKKKLDELNKDYAAANDGLTEFKTYINSLRSSAENAYNLVYDYYYRLKTTEELLRDINIPSFAAQFDETVDNIYAMLNEIFSLINVKPIDVININEKVEQLKDVANRFFDEIDSKSRECHLAESMILYCNRDRRQQTDVDRQLCILEERFFHGDFEEVYHDANAIFKRSHIEDRSGNGH